MDKWITIRDPEEIIANHRSYLAAEAVFYTLGLLTFIHAFRHGGRHIHIWIAAFLFGVVVEVVSNMVPGMDNFWHAQSSVMLAEKRLPLHIVVAYPTFYYVASVASSALNLKKSEPFAVGLLVTLFDIPVDIVGSKLVWWSWHDSNPSFADRSFGVPLISYLIHVSFASSLLTLFWVTRRLLTRTSDYALDSWWREWLCTLITAALAMPLGVVLLVVFYRVPHNVFGVHTELCLILDLLIYGFVVLAGIVSQSAANNKQKKSIGVTELLLCVVIHYIFYIVLAAVESPVTVRSIGLHQPIGNCDTTVVARSLLGKAQTRKSNLCPTDYNSELFDINCDKLPKPSGTDETVSWYTICGTPYEHYAEYALSVCMFSVFGLFVFWLLLKDLSRPAVQSATPSKVKVKGQ